MSTLSELGDFVPGESAPVKIAVKNHKYYLRPDGIVINGNPSLAKNYKNLGIFPCDKEGKILGGDKATENMEAVLRTKIRNELRDEVMREIQAEIEAEESRPKPEEAEEPRPKRGRPPKQAEPEVGSSMVDVGGLS